MNSRVRHDWAAIATALGSLLLCWLFVTDGTAAGQHRILLLHSYAPPMDWVNQITLAVEDVLQPVDNQIDLRIEFMDTKRHHTPQYLARLLETLAVKYADLPIDLIISSDNNAFNFLRRYRETLYPGVPVVFCGVNNFNPADLDGIEGFTGVAEVYSPRSTVELMLHLHPDTQEILVVNDYLTTGLANRQFMTRELEPLAGQVNLAFNDDLPLDELQAQIAHLKPGQLLLLGTYYADRDGRHSTFNRIGNKLMSVSPVPTYCLLDFNLGGGVVGGKVTGAYDQGQAAALIAHRILAGADPAGIPVMIEGATTYRFDHQALQRWGIDSRALPSGSEVINKPESLFQQHRRLVVSVLVVIIALVITIAVLTFNINRRRLAEEALRINEQDLSITLDSIGDGVIATDQGGLVTRMNPLAEHLTGWPLAEAVGQPLTEVFEVRPGPGKTAPDFNAVLVTGRRIELERGSMLVARDGTERLIADSGAPIQTADGEVCGIVIVFRDVSEQVQLEDQLRHSQKMESVGQLAGGIAHDFNNVLTAVVGFAEILQNNLKDNEDLQECATGILHAGERANNLTSKLLAFSRKGKLLSTPIDVHDVVTDTMSLLRHTISKTITLEEDLGAKKATVIGDPTNLEQALLNLCLNARDAMPDGGCITIRTLDIHLDASACQESPFEIEPGPFVRLEVTDTGFGIPDQVLEHIFEPFFTTKEMGKGTGLGLAAVYGTITDHHGAVTVASSRGQGTTFTIDLPRSSETVVKVTDAPRLPATKAQGWILVVDDDATIRSMVSNMLEDLGYQVILAENGVEGLEIFAQNRERLTAVLLDMVMPRLGGRECFRSIRHIDPTAQVILCSGFTAEHNVSDLLKEGLCAFLKKPFRQNELSQVLALAQANSRQVDQ